MSDETAARAPEDAEGTLNPDNALLRLHAALSELDRALYEALRALDRALGRPPMDEPKRPLPLQELSSLREHLRRVRNRYETPGTRRSIVDIAGEPPGWEPDGDDGSDEPQVGVAPSGPLKVE